MSKFFDEFKEFALKGNVMDMAVGVVIGGAFKAIVDSLVENVINPVIGMLGGNDLAAYAIQLNENTAITYGAFLSAILNFLIIALVLFCVVKAVNKARAAIKPEVEEEPTTKECPYCLNQIPIKATRCGFCTSEVE